MGLESVHENQENPSPTASSVASLMSTKTDEHNELYDHRQHHEYDARSSNAAISNADDNARPRPHASRKSSEVLGPKQGEIPKFKPNVFNSGISFDDNSDDEYSRLAFKTLNAGAARVGSSEGVPRVAAPRQSQQSVGREAPSEKTDATAGPPDSAKSRRESKAQSAVDTSFRNKVCRVQSNASSQGVHFLTRTVSYKSQESGVLNTKRNRKLSVDSADSNASRESQETEEDVCFPMQQPEHTRINGIDFDELAEFSAESMRLQIANNMPIRVSQVSGKLPGTPGTSSGTSTTISSAALKYTPKEIFSQSERRSSEEQLPAVSFGNNRVESDYHTPMNDLSSNLNESGFRNSFGNFSTQSTPAPNYKVPDRFSFFCSDAEETTHAPDIPSLVEPGQSFKDLFRDGRATWWLDCICPTDEEMRCIAKAFGIHPLTAEDVRMQETREKVELFKSYYFVCFHTFENDPESEDFLEPINMYIVVFRNGVLTFHFTPVSHPSNVRRRVRQLRDYVDVNSDWICYALIDDITDGFAPVIQTIEYEADLIEDSVFMSRDMDVAVMLQTIGEGRRKTMTLMRLLSGKADVIKMFAKRCQDEANGIGPALTSDINIANLQYGQSGNATPRFGPQVLLAQALSENQKAERTQPRADIALYLGDIQDHVVTMFQNLLSYEKIFSRSHSNYLAQLQVESFRCNNRVTEMLGKVTMIGTMLVPLNLITGLFGMNVHVPGQETGGYAWFLGILGFLFCLATTSWILSSWWISRVNAPVTLNEAAESGTKSILNFRSRRNRQSMSKTEGTKSIKSCPSRIGRYY